MTRKKNTFSLVLFLCGSLLQAQTSDSLTVTLQKIYQEADIPNTRLASLYLSNGLHIPHYRLITYPDGGLFTNMTDFSRYLKEMIKGINGESELLSQAAFQEMMQNQLVPEHFPEGQFETAKGLMWSVNPEGDNISMNGSDPGVLSYTLFTTAGNLGIAIL